MNRRFRARLFNSFIGIVTAALILLFLSNYSDTRSLPTLGGESDLESRSNYFLINPEIKKFNQKGVLAFTLTSSEVEQDPTDSSARLIKPQLNLYNEGQQQWTISAELGTISSDGDRLDLERQVVIQSEDRETILQTAKLTLIPDRKLAETDNPVTLQTPYGLTRAIGLRADMNENRVELLHQVRGNYEGLPIEHEQ